MDVIYKYRNDDVDFSEVVRILKNAFGDRGFNLLDVKKSFINSSHVIFAFQNNNLIGFARAISDSSSSIIYNVAIDPTYQSIGVGKDIVNKLVEHLGKRLILAFTHPRTISFYEHLGFNRIKNAFKYVKNRSSERTPRPSAVRQALRSEAPRHAARHLCAEVESRRRLKDLKILAFLLGLSKKIATFAEEISKRSA